MRRWSAAVLSATSLAVKRFHDRAAATGLPNTPALESTARESLAPDTPNRGALPITNRMKILLVEDHDDTRGVLLKLLERWGHAVTATAYVTEAVGLLANFRFDLLLSDIGLPDGDGYRLVTEAKRRQSLQAVALTAWASTADRENGRRAGFDHYLTKPLDVTRLLSLIGRS